MENNRISTGVQGLDHILRGGFLPGFVYLVHGAPGSGKTTFSFQFLREGVGMGERVMYVSLLQTRAELETILASYGWSLDGISLLELPEEVRDASVDGQTLFNSADVELQELSDAMMAAIQKYRPQRLVFDSISEMAVLIDNPYQLRRQMLKLKHLLGSFDCTTLFTVNDNDPLELASIQTLVHGVIELGIDRPQFGPPRRWLEAPKMRGMTYLAGRHSFSLEGDGLNVYPRLEIPEHSERTEWDIISSGNTGLDTLFGGGLEEGTACLFMGTSGSGKSTLATLYVEAAAKRGEHSVIFCFDERKHTFLRRAAGLDMKLPEYIAAGLVDPREVNVGDITPGQFGHEIRRSVIEQNAKVVVIDSISGYLNAVSDRGQLLVQLHEILSYLSEAGVLTLLIVASHGFQPRATEELDTSYMSDTLVLLRNFEAEGTVRRCISVIKKRHGEHERTIREVMIDNDGVKIGPPLKQFQGVLTGNPIFVGTREKLMDTLAEEESEAE
jgi:circadian clock protein KaiC